MTDYKQLTKNFNEKEFACHCCGEVTVNPRLAAALQELRELLNKPIILNCGYRCIKHNAEIGSDYTSQHVKGTAADIRVDGFTPEQLAKEADKVIAFKNGGIGIYHDKGFVHVDVRPYRARWVD